MQVLAYSWISENQCSNAFHNSLQIPFKNITVDVVKAELQRIFDSEPSDGMSFCAISK